MVHGWAADGAPIVQMELRLLVIQEGIDSCQCLYVLLDSTYIPRFLPISAAFRHTVVGVLASCLQGFSRPTML